MTLNNEQIGLLDIALDVTLHRLNFFLAHANVDTVEDAKAVIPHMNKMYGADAIEPSKELATKWATEIRALNIPLPYLTQFRLGWVEGGPNVSPFDFPVGLDFMRMLEIEVVKHDKSEDIKSRLYSYWQKYLDTGILPNLIQFHDELVDPTESSREQALLYYH